MKISAVFGTGFVVAIFMNIILSDQSLCGMHTSPHSLDFPSGQNHPLIPWVWDASLSLDRKFVEVVSVSRFACYFNSSQRDLLISLYPQYENHLGGNLNDSLLVPMPFDSTVIAKRRARRHFLIGSRLTCFFLKGTKVAAVTKSDVIEGKKMTDISTLTIRCPLPQRTVYTSLRLERRKVHPFHDPHLANTTDTFAICDLKKHYQDLYLSPKQFKLSICTATNRVNRSHIVEWIEYHIMMGVQHFFIYDLFPKSNQSLLRHLLADYITERIVTVISWPYSNCVRGMASGRWVHFKNGEERIYFQPPRVISQTGALASCFSRFKHTSEWIAHVDDDEFLAFDSSAYSSEAGAQVKTLVSLLDHYSALRPKAIALYFKPINVLDCQFIETRLNIGVARMNNSGGPSTILPRFARWRTTQPGLEFEGKLIMRTAAVGMFFVHYVIFKEAGSWDSDPIILNISHAAVLHYKMSPENAGTIFGTRIPYAPGDKPRDCRRYDAQSIANVNASRYRRRMTRSVRKALEERYLARITTST